MKRFSSALIAIIYCCCSFAQGSQEKVVQSFVETLSTWCKTADDIYREKLGELTNENIGTNSNKGYGCRVNNKLMIMLHSFIKENHPNSSIDIGKGNMEISTYLNYLTWAIEDELSYTHGKPIWLKDFKEPVAYIDKEEIPLFVYDVDESTNGAIIFNGRSQYWVRGNQITYILDDDDPMARALQLYNDHEYESAFKIFRELAYENPNNYEAQYYTAVMEIKKQGCGYLDSKIRDTEAAWWVTRGSIASSFSHEWYKDRMAKLYVKYSVDEKKLPYNTHGKNVYISQLMSAKLVTEGMMPIKKRVGNYWLYGYMNEKGKLVIPCKYAWLGGFNKNGLSLASKDMKYGFIDKQGKEVIPLKYDMAIPYFKNGRTFVLLNEALLLIDEGGNVIKEVGKGFDIIYSNIVRGNVYVHNKYSQKIYLYNIDGEIVSVENEGYKYDYTKNCFFAVDKEGNRLFEESFEW